MMMNYSLTLVLQAALTGLINITHASQICSSGRDCGNGYECQDGEKNYEAMDIFPDVMLDELAIFEDDGTMEYCDCEEYLIIPGGLLGMTGVACDEMFGRCPDGTVCFHGAPCQKGADDNYFCNCPKTVYPPDKTFVGEHCQYEVTSWCDYSENEEYDLSKTGKWMCANDSTCQPSRSLLDKCKCPPGFDGFHCEYKGDSPLCNLGCLNGGICKHGVKNYDSLPPALQEYFEQDDQYDAHCICPNGFTGLRCETAISNCGDTGISACINGGQCQQGIELNGYDYFYCNCEMAMNPAISDDEMDTKFAGNYCESSSSTFCPTPPGFDQMDFFCTNMGECPTNYWEPCLCSKDYSGPRCEFLVQHHTECTLECLNGGTCFHGDNRISIYDVDLNTEALLSEQNNMHCKCPDGFLGARCGTEIEICGAFELYCLNDGMCIENDVGDYECDCPSGSGVNYTEPHCDQVEATICGDSPGSFCINNGKCKTKRTVTGDLEEDGCICENGFYGRQCELSGGGKELSKAVAEDFMWIYFLILVTITFVICVLFCKARADIRSSDGHMPVDTTHYLD